MKKLFILGLLCLSVLGGYAQDDSDDWKVGGKHYQEWVAKQTCTEVCGVRFGSSYETAKEILKRKYYCLSLQIVWRYEFYIHVL